MKMNLNVFVHCGEEIDDFEMPIECVERYVNLIKEYGYEDMEGERYVHTHTIVEGLSVCIYLDRVSPPTKEEEK